MSVVESLMEMVFDSVAPIKVHVRLGDQDWWLHEATGGDVATWRNAQLAEMKMIDGKLTSMGNAADNEAHLVGLCLKNAKGENAGRQFAKELPSKVLSALNKRLRQISEIDPEPTPDQLREQIKELQTKLERAEGGETGPKVVPAATTDGSV